jgi:NADPH-dependent 2,4-dienoyl-CoA reductase/sulfur reductase-like enzyme
MKIIIVGGVAGGASCAARLRRLDETAEILMVERGPYVSYANCGLPYHIGGVIEREASLLVASERTFREQFNIDTRTNCEAVSVDPRARTIDLRNVLTGEVTTEAYDKLVLSPGARTVRPPSRGSTCRASSRSGRFPTRGRSGNGWRGAPPTWLA